MKKLLFSIVAAFLAAGLASAQEIRDIRTVVGLQKDGSARVVQTWDITVTSGTEYYIPVDNPGKSYIRDFSVSENGQEYLSEGRKWNSDRSLQAKAGRCGIIEKRGGNIELCWGLGGYGDHEYVLSYTIDNLVQSYDECDGFHWHFLNDEWSVKPRHVSIEIQNRTGGDPWYWKDENDNNVQFWGFGMEGESWLSEGVVYFESTAPFDFDSRFSALMRFRKGQFAPAVEGDGTFEALKDEAMYGSDYGEDEKDSLFDRFYYVFFFLMVVVLPVLIIGVVLFHFFRKAYRKVSGRHYDKQVFGVDKIEGWFRDVPMDGNPTAFFSLLHKGDLLHPNPFSDFPDLVSAYFLKWIQDGLLAVEKDPKDEKRTNLRFVKHLADLDFDDEMEKKVYLGALDAAGENRLLEADEFKAWSYKHDGTVSDWPSAAIDTGHSVWFKLSQEERRHAVEFKNFLSDYTLIGERSAPEVALWKQYLVLAASLGIADKVAENFGKLFPKVMEQYLQETRMFDTQTAYYVLNHLRTSSRSMMSSALSHQSQRRAAQAAATRRTYGGGGSISRGGGHGGFGGGHGGGTR
ncbi:MAG: DUF2207 domain-containing protein [Bacteroidales bacterium]|nr:DUF2207 domain-containing protein [Bacteroidales bacterium]